MSAAPAKDQLIGNVFRKAGGAKPSGDSLTARSVNCKNAPNSKGGPQCTPRW